MRTPRDAQGDAPANDTRDAPRAAQLRSVMATRPAPPEPDPDWNAIGSALESIDAPNANHRAAVEAVVDLLPAIDARQAQQAERAAQARAREHMLALRAVVAERCAAGRAAGGEIDDKTRAALRKHLAAASKALGMPERLRRIDSTERVKNRIGAGPLLHVPTPLKTLNEFTRGGIIAGRVCVIGGAPDAGKTSLAVQLAHHAALHGYAVAIHCVDEDSEGIDCRIGQACGIALEHLEQRKPEALRELAYHLEQVPNLMIVDQDEDDMTIEDTADALVDLGMRHGCSPGLVLVIDSLQTARARGIENAHTAKDRADMVTAAAKSIARRTGALVIITSELARGAYRARTAKDRIEPMAAFKESGAIEYAMTIGLVLTNVKGEANVVRVDVPKNKRGERGAFLLRRNPRRCTYEDGGRVEDEDEGDSGARQGSGDGPNDPQIERDMERARHVLRSHPGIAGIDAWVDEIGINKSRARAACRRLMTRGEVEDRRERGRPRFYWRSPASEPSEPTAAEEQEDHTHV
ncbi:DnaB-like helicase C-terminal domain-containing protein [Sorangium sp. So ce315]|uniref:DnaB-like helicase C-terminal domain-containing protein n=1 Tax=Sorangium sp. So ce315 TaxID=3133299 RepID=UPI003F5F6316